VRAKSHAKLKQAYYAGPGSRFWRVPGELKLTEAEIPAIDYRRCSHMASD
jgi:G:T/U-mismatch repair DNA glycosylase